MTKLFRYPAVFVGLAVLTAAGVSAHPGGVDAKGCHQGADAVPHCHMVRKAQTTGKPAPVSETPEQREKRLRRVCKGKVPGGECTSEWTGKK